MRRSVLIIAHNEERYIGKSIESVLDQTVKADEVVVVAHNSTDKTLEIAKKYPVRAIDFFGSTGATIARLEGFKQVTGDIVLCLDGDSYAAPNWIETLSKLLEKGNILVGSRIKFKGTLYREISNFTNKPFFHARNLKAAGWIWAASFGFWKKDLPNIEDLYQKSIELSFKLRLARNPEDFWLGMFLAREGNLTVTNKTWVTAHEKEKSTWESFVRNMESVRNAHTIKKYLIST